MRNMLKKFIAFQAEHPDILTISTQVLSAESTSTNEAYTPKSSATLMQSNRRYDIWLDEDQLIKIKHDKNGNVKKIVHLKYENNFGTLHNLLALIHDLQRHQKFPHLINKILYHIIKKLLTLIQTFHAHSWYHNDIKPLNILICPKSSLSWEPFNASQLKLRYEHRKQAAYFLSKRTPCSKANLKPNDLTTTDPQFDNFKHNLIQQIFCAEANEIPAPKPELVTTGSAFLCSLCCVPLFFPSPRKKLQTRFLDLLLTNTFCLKLCDFEWVTQETTYSKNTGTHGYLDYVTQIDASPLPVNRVKDRFALGITLLSMLIPNDFKAYLKNIHVNFTQSATATQHKILIEQARSTELTPKLQHCLSLAIQLTSPAFDTTPLTATVTPTPSRINCSTIFSCVGSNTQKNEINQPLIPFAV
jgi:serine/threonine protein kinase